MSLLHRMTLFFFGLILLLSLYFLMTKNVMQDYKEAQALDFSTRVEQRNWDQSLAAYITSLKHEFASALRKNKKDVTFTESTFRKDFLVKGVFKYDLSEKTIETLFVAGEGDGFDTAFIKLQYQENMKKQYIQDFEKKYYLLFTPEFKKFKDGNFRYVILIDVEAYLQKIQHKNGADYFIYNQNNQLIYSTNPGLLEQIEMLSSSDLQSGFYKSRVDDKVYSFLVFPLKLDKEEPSGYLMVSYDETIYRKADNFWGNALLIANIVVLFIGFIVVYFYMTKMISPLEYGIGLFKKMIRNEPVSFRYFANDIPDYAALEKYYLMLLNRHIAYDRIQLQKNRFQKNLKGFIDLKKELDVAAKIQLSVLPEAHPDPKEIGVNLNAMIVPAKEVGGDFYDYFKIDENRIGIVMADVSGKGVAAALFMILSRTLLKAYATQNLSVAQTLEKTNKVLAAQNPEMMFVTLIYGIYDLKKKEFTYSVAGHPPIFLYEADHKMTPLPMTKNIALGINPDAKFLTKKIKLNKGQTLFLYTDGVTEALNIDKNEYGNRFVDLFAGESLAPNEILQKIFQNVRAFSCDVEQSDDITMLAFSVNE